LTALGSDPLFLRRLRAAQRRVILPEMESTMKLFATTTIAAALIASAALATPPVRNSADLRSSANGIASLTDTGAGNFAAGRFESRAFGKSYAGRGVTESTGAATVRSLRFGPVNGIADGAYGARARIGRGRF